MAFGTYRGADSSYSSFASYSYDTSSSSLSSTYQPDYTNYLSDDDLLKPAIDSKSQTTPNIIMVRPANFGYNEETAGTNFFQSCTNVVTPLQISEMALKEFENFKGAVEEVGINVEVLEDTRKPIKPCAVFPDWITTFADGKIVLSSFLAKNRRHERRRDFIRYLQEHYIVTEVIELTELESQGCFIEGKGSMVLDRTNKIMYACKSERTHINAVEAVCDKIGYHPIRFTATDDLGKEIYHTDVMLVIGPTFVVICWEAIKDPQEKKMLEDSFNRTSREVIEISLDQVRCFAGNILCCENKAGEMVLVMSENAFNCYNKEQLQQFRKHVVEIVYRPIKTIETMGGGSAHCITTEIFLPKRPVMTFDNYASGYDDMMDTFSESRHGDFY